MIYSLIFLMQGSALPEYGEIVVGDPSVCGVASDKARCRQELVQVELALDSNASCGRAAIAALVTKPAKDVSADQFARKLSAVSGKCRTERAYCLNLSITFSKRFVISDRQKLERTVEECEAKFWQAVIEGARASGPAYPKAAK